jgi:glycosyltransferase involved in cell wall biosynthesis
VIVGIDVTAAVGPDLSGVGFHIIRLLEAFDALGEPDLRFRAFFPASSRRDLIRARERLPACARIIPTPVPFIATSWYTLHRSYRAWWLPLFVRATRCDVYHGPAHQIPRLPALPTVVTIHDLAFFRFELYPAPFTRALRYVVQSSVSRASAVIALSEHTRRELAALLQRERDVQVIYGAGNYASEPERLVQPTDANGLRALGIVWKYVLYVGDFGVRKNLPYLIESYAALRRDRRGPDVQLVLAGNSAGSRESLLALGARLGLAPGSVVLPGRVSDADLAMLYRNADAFALCSVMEGFTLVTLEAMSYGVPVVATRTSSIEEGTERAAELVPLDDPEAVAEGLRRALTPGPRRDEMRALGFDRIKRFSWDTAARLTLALYRDVSARTAGERKSSRPHSRVSSEASSGAPPATGRA